MSCGENRKASFGDNGFGRFGGYYKLRLEKLRKQYLKKISDQEKL
jgi:hypothetical protein